MKVLVLGSGSAFSDKYGNTQLYISDNSHRNPDGALLFDCGATHMENTRVCNFKRDSIRNIFISHVHADHVNGLSTLALMHYFMYKRRPNLYVPKTILDKLWSSMAPNLETLADHQLPAGRRVCQLDDYFDVKVLQDNSTFKIGNMVCSPIQTVHVVHGGDFMYSYGLEIEEDGVKLLVTGDTQFAPHQLMDRFNRCDAVIHDCEIGPFKSGVHAHLDDLSGLPENIRRKLYLIHYGDAMDPEYIASIHKNTGMSAMCRGEEHVIMHKGV